MTGLGPISARDAASIVEAGQAARTAASRADFIAGLGKRVAELRDGVRVLVHDPLSTRQRDDLRRRIHALAAAAKLLGFSAMSSALQEAERALDPSHDQRAPSLDSLRVLTDTVENLTALAWAEPSTAPSTTLRPRPPDAASEEDAVAASVLVVGPKGLADALAQKDGETRGLLECERAEPETARERARSLDPDIVVLDADLDGASDLLADLVHDSMMCAPVVAIGTWPTPEYASKWLDLGATRVIAKPASPGNLQALCRELAIASRPTMHGPLGALTVPELADRLADEVRKGLCDALLPQARAARVPLGHGAEVLAAIGSAVARVRELVTIKTDGAVRFSNDGPDGAIPIALWWANEPPLGERAVGVSRRLEPESLLDRRTVIVADDDPAVAWFVSSVLRAAGATVREAHRGDDALNLCLHYVPDLVITDVLMPGLDGFALCRALKRDIALRDVPVILLSWKEDLLQRLRELGAQADGYLRKEASAVVVLERAIEVLRPRLRIEARLCGEGEVRGRLDGITPRTLLGMVACHRPEARVCLHDAAFLYEMELRGGELKSITRTTSDGMFQRGQELLGPMLGVRAGRFVVLRAEGSVRQSMSGSLASQTAAPIARARAAAALLSGTRLLEVHRVRIDVEGIAPYLRATPEPVRKLVDRLANGASPRAIVVGGEVAPSLLEDVLGDLAAHGAVRGVESETGQNLLSAELNVLRDAVDPGRRATIRPAGLFAATPDSPDPDPDPDAPTPALAHALVAPTLAPVAPFGRLDASPPARAHVERVDVAASDLSSVVPPEIFTVPGVSMPPMQEDRRAPSPPRVGPPSPSRSVAPRAEEARAPRDTFDGLEEETPPVGPPHEEPSGDEPTRIPPPVAARAELPSDLDAAPGSLEAAVIRELTSARADATPAPVSLVERPDPAPALRRREARAAQAVQPAGDLSGTSEAERRPVVGEEDPHELVVPANEAPRLPAAPPLRADPQGHWFLAATVLLAAIGVVAFAARFGMDKLSDGQPLAPSVSVGSASGRILSPGAGPATSIALSARAQLAAAPAPPTGTRFVLPPASAALGGDHPPDSRPPRGPSLPEEPTTAVEDTALPPGVNLAAGQGLLDLETPGRETIFIDGVALGRGPSVRLTLAPGVHEVRIKAAEEERSRFVLIQDGRRAHLNVPAPWSR